MKFIGMTGRSHRNSHSTMNLAGTKYAPGIVDRPAALKQSVLIVFYDWFSGDFPGCLAHPTNPWTCYPSNGMRMESFSEEKGDTCMPASLEEYNRDPEYWHNIKKSFPYCKHYTKYVIKAGTASQITNLIKTDDFENGTRYGLAGKVDYEPIRGKIVDFSKRFITVKDGVVSFNKEYLGPLEQ